MPLAQELNANFSNGWYLQTINKSEVSYEHWQCHLRKWRGRHLDYAHGNGTSIEEAIAKAQACAMRMDEMEEAVQAEKKGRAKSKGECTLTLDELFS